MNFHSLSLCLQEYELLYIIDFNNTRKRMSVILRRNNKIFLYCKGADNVIYERLASHQNELKTRTQEHLNVSFIRSNSNLHCITHPLSLS